MAILPGAIKLDFIFDEPHNSEPPWQPDPTNLGAIDAHFWDWALWLLAKQVKGSSALVTSELHKMFNHILHPMGVQVLPASLRAAVETYLVARGRMERDFEVEVSRALEREALRALDVNGVL
jgi:hypothetical protein